MLDLDICSDCFDKLIDRFAEDKLHIEIGKASCYCYDDMDVTVQLNDGATMETVTMQLYEDLSDRLSA